MVVAMRWRRRISAALLGCSLLAARGASAQQAVPEEVPTAEGGVKVIVSPYVWAASLGGDVGLAGIGAPIHLPFADILENLDLVAMGNVEIVKGRVGAYLDGQYVKTSQQEQVLGIPVDLTVRITRVSAGAFYKAVLVRANQGRTLSLEPTAGLRWTRLSADASVPVAAISKKADWADPFLGIRINADLTRRWNLFAEADAGVADGSTSSVYAQAYLGYRARIIGRPAILRIGYRYISQDYRTPDFTGLGNFVWDTGQRGPVAGISIVF